MIIGVGVDIVEIDRVARILEKYGDRFLKRVFTEREVEYAFRSRVKVSERLAGRFAVKEAVMKVLGTGKSSGILWKDIETVRGPGGKPEVILHGRARDHSESQGISDVIASISHDGNRAIGFVIGEGEK